MTEKDKRFKYIEHKGADYILDSPDWDLPYLEMLDNCLEPEEIVDLLNKQDDEIKDLKCRINNIYTILMEEQM